jgi:hypothetical protein
MASVAIYPGAATKVTVGGQSVIAVFGNILGGFLANPSTSGDQGIAAIEPLYVSLIGDATLGESDTTFTLYPGQGFTLPAGLTSNVSVNAATSGHRFSAIVYHSPIQFPPTPNGDTFPPAVPTTLTKTIPSYLYTQYADDDDLQAFVDAFNTLAQQYVDWFVNIGLPVYTAPQISGPLLDWVAQGLYGLSRPSLPSGHTQTIGPLNTYAFNSLTLNSSGTIGSVNYFATNDDVYKRILTWHFYKGDGKVFNIRWLKRRIMRFLYGVNGADFNVDQTYPISISFGPGNQVNILLTSGSATVTGGAIFGQMVFNTAAFGEVDVTHQSFSPSPMAPILQAAIDAGVLELPFQYKFVVNTN